MADVAEAAGVSRQSVYLHFKARGQLMSEMMRHRLLQHPLAQEARRLALGPASIETFEAFVEATIRFTLSVVGPAAREFGASVEDNVVQAALRERLKTGVAMIQRMTEGLKHQGLLRKEWSALEASQWLAAQLGPTNLYTLRVLMGWPVQRIVERMSATLRQALIEDDPDAKPT
jgi:AcrR family transcriptional regulator